MTDTAAEPGCREALARLVLGIAHELNNPNTHIRLSAANMSRLVHLLRPALSRCPDLVDGRTPLEILALLEAAAAGVLDASARIGAAAERLKACTVDGLQRAAAVDLDVVVRDVLACHAYLAGDGTRFRYRCHADLPAEVPGFRLLLEQAVSCLVTNAHDAVADRRRAEPGHVGRVELALADTADGLAIEVRDDGCGMDSATRDAAFDLYFTTKEFGHGDGLGLPLCRSIATQHGGRIAVVSERGAGTTVTLVFPRKGRT
ncbi:MAG: HAMP domain-containing sensor histidine kinase [Candidatus Krumholzibacteriia bacterium]